MKKFTVILFFIYSHCLLSFAQDSPLEMMMNNELKIAQKENTDSLLKEYLSPISCESDTLYAILFSPMSCPRCEATIPFFTKTMKEIYPQSKTLLISDYEDPDAAKQYLVRNGYMNMPDYHLFDPDRTYAKIFSFNTDGLYGIYILKIDKKHGRLILGGNPVEQNKRFVREVYEAQKPYPYHCFEIEESGTNMAANLPEPVAKPLAYDTFSVTEDDLYPVSGVFDYPVLKDGLFFYSDELGNAGYLFKTDKKRKSFDFKAVFVADSLEKDRYVNIPLEDYAIRKRNGIIHYIACGMNFTENNKIGLSYSLPKLFMETPTNMAYYNQPAIIVKEAGTLKKEPMVELDFDLFNESFMYLHFNFFPMGDGKIILECKKNTWPIEFPVEDYKGNAERDPFMDAFYDTDCPYLAVFDIKTGKMQQRFGQLDIAQRLSRTGYYYDNAVVSCLGQSLVYGNGFTGKLHLAAKNNPSKIEKEFSAFEIDTEHFPPLDTLAFYKQEYGRIYDSFFSKCIVSTILTRDKIACLIREGMPHNRNNQTDGYEFVSFDRKSGKETERFRLVPETSDRNGRILCFGLGQDGEHVTPYYFIKKDHKAYIKFMYRDK